ncbi:MAG: hypothetical protein MUE81_00075 [Thermoflexibacter sp.]|jgi:hypothetical protein|nr:hypothetical protein [Thermoflexibacter sp.]
MAKKLKNTISLTDVANVIEKLDLYTTRECKHLQVWWENKGAISPIYEILLEQRRKELEINLSAWNEEELKMEFVSPVFQASELNIEGKIKVFYERPLEATLQGYEFAVICDCIVATPTQAGRPQNPYFFLQEFKKAKGDTIDPEAQMLVAMLIAQQKNNNNKPIYGGWFRGENWHFTTLNGNEYCTAPTLFATRKEDLQQIVYMLQYLKTLV